MAPPWETTGVFFLIGVVYSGVVWNGQYSGGEVRKARPRLARFCNGFGFDIGPGYERIKTEAIGIGMASPAVTWQMDLDAPRFGECFADGICDYIFSSHCLEHVKDYRLALRQWWRLVKPGGFLVLYLPHKDYYPKVGYPGANTEHQHDFDPDDILRVLREFAAFEVLANEVHGEADEYSFDLVVRKLGGLPNQIDKTPKITDRTCCVSRYGGWGDQMMASVLLPALKRRGFHVTYYGTDKAKDLLARNPHIDRFWLYDDVGIGMMEMWGRLAREFDVHLNMNSKIECKLIFREGLDPEYFQPKDQRDRISAGSYIDRFIGYANEQMVAAGFEPLEVRDEEKASVYYQNATEKYIMSMARETCRDKFLIGWVLNGSANHKIWPWAGKAAELILKACPKAVIYTLGDEDSKPLEFHGGQVRNKAGAWTIRQAAGFLQTCDAVVTPETGLAHCVAGTDARKVVMLTHSDRENLVKYWTNTVGIEPEGVPCFPCHQIHHTMRDCLISTEVPNKQAFPLCTASIRPDRVADEIVRAYTQWEKGGDDETFAGVQSEGDENGNRAFRDGGGSSQGAQQPVHVEGA